MTVEKPKVLQKPLWDESVFAIKECTNFSAFQDFRKHIEATLPQNAEYVRVRYTRSIIRWFFPERSLDVIPAKVWRYYGDETILKEVMRYYYLLREPSVMEFIVKHLLPLAPGTSVTPNYLKEFIIKTYGTFKNDSMNALRIALRDLGFAYSIKGELFVREIPIPKTAFLILTHDIFAPTPQTITLKEILKNPYWQCLGIRDQNIVRNILKEANSKGLIVKYIIADELEQITTRFTLNELLEGRMRL